MAKNITIKAPAAHTVTSANKAGAKEGDLCEKTLHGQVAWLYVREGESDPSPVRVKCFLVKECGKAINVTHYASGMRLRALGGAILDCLAQTGKIPTAHAAAQMALDDLVKTHGKDAVLNEMEKQEVLNP